MRTICTFLLVLASFSFTAYAQSIAEIEKACPQVTKHLEVPSQILIEGKPPQVAFLFSDGGIDVYMILEPPAETKATPPISKQEHPTVGKQPASPQLNVQVGIATNDTRSWKESGFRYSGEALWVYQDETAREEAVKAMLKGNSPVGFNTYLFYSKFKFVTFDLRRFAGDTGIFKHGNYFEPAECGPAYPYGLVSGGPNLKVRETNVIGGDVSFDAVLNDGSKTALLLYRTEKAMEAKEKWKEQAK
jgi:hypothetical protein